MPYKQLLILGSAKPSLPQTSQEEVDALHRILPSEYLRLCSKKIKRVIHRTRKAVKTQGDVAVGVIHFFQQVDLQKQQEVLLHNSAPSIIFLPKPRRVVSQQFLPEVKEKKDHRSLPINLKSTAQMLKEAGIEEQQWQYDGPD